MDKKLFVIYIGGRTTQSLIELHDLRFVVAARIEETFEELKKTWWGLPESLHLDCWGALEFADGHRLEFSSTPSQSPQKLFFINLGGYSKKEFTEVHRNVFLVAETEAEAKKRAVTMIQDCEQGHKDHLYDVESAICLTEALKTQDVHLNLKPVSVAPQFQFEFGYVPIGKGKGLTGRESKGEMSVIQ